MTKYLLLILFSWASAEAQEQCALIYNSADAKKCELGFKLTQDLKTISEKRRNLSCPSQQELKKKGIKELMVIMDGGGVYSPKLFHLSRQIDQLKRFMNDSQKEKYKPFFKDLKKILLNSNKEGSYILEFMFNENFQNLYPEHLEILYFGQEHYRPARRCLRRLLKGNPFKVKFLTLSWGADTTHRLLKKLRKSNITVESVFMIDPVRKGFLGAGALKNILSRKNSRFFYKTSNTKKLYNFYQKTDDGSLGLTKIYGNSISSANKNINLSDFCFQEAIPTRLLPITHKSMFFCPVLREYFLQFMND